MIEYLTKTEAARRMGISRVAFYRVYLDTGRVPVFRVNGRERIRADMLPPRLREERHWAGDWPKNSLKRSAENA